MIREMITRTNGSKMWAMIFEKDTRAGASIDCISVFVAMSIVMLIVAMEC